MTVPPHLQPVANALAAVLHARHPEHTATGPLNAFPRFKHDPQITAHPAEVGNSKTAVPALLNTDHSLVECGPALERQTPTDIQFWRKQMHGVPACPDRPLNVSGLVAHRMKPVGVHVPAPDVRHSDHSSPKHARTLYADTWPGMTTEPVSSIHGPAPESRLAGSRATSEDC